MKRESVFLMVLLTFLVVSSSAALEVQGVEASATVYIRADGSIDPPTAPISTIDNITYAFTGDINDSIVIERDDIVVDGALYIVEGAGSGIGITLSGRTNVTIMNMTIKAFGQGIWLDSSSSYNNISGNNITNNNSLGGIRLTNSSDNSISGNNITDNGCGIFFGFEYSKNNTISGNSIIHNRDVGILLYNSAGNSISGNIIANTKTGISFDHGSGSNTVSGNNITDNVYGISLFFSSSNSISENNITINHYGIELASSSNNNFIFYNNFVGNIDHVSIELSSVNIWDDGSRGNYWSDYLTMYPNATEIDSSGVWNTPYVIDAYNVDLYPLMVQHVIPEFPSYLLLLLIIVTTVLAIMISRKKRSGFTLG